MTRFIKDKDFEKLWFLYQTEGVPEEESINSFCKKNGVPYEEFDKWFRKTHQAVGRVEIENIPDDAPTLKSSRRRSRKTEPEGIQVTIQTSDGLHLRKVGLTYQGLKSLVEKLEGLC